MCFSATASFTASGVTALAGVLALSTAKNTPHRLLAGIPIYFALHQFAEGVLWRSLEGDGNLAWQAPAMFFFLVVAKVIWPAWVPLAVRSIEPEAGRRHLLSGLLVFGVIESAAEGWALTAHAVTAHIAGGHISYHIAIPPVLRAFVDTAYVLVVVVPPFLSSSRLMQIIGVGSLASLIVAKVTYPDAAASVWCFFAAFISALIVAIVRADALGRSPRTGPAAA